MAVDHGDGATSGEAISQHMYEAPGVYNATLTVVDGEGRRTSASQTVNVHAVEGSWFHFGYNTRTHGAEVRRLTLTSQSGRAVTGEFVGATALPVPVNGILEGERTLRLTVGSSRIEGMVPSEVFAEGVTLPLGAFTDFPEPQLLFTPIIGTPTGPPPVAKLHLQIDSAGSVVAIAGLSPVLFSGIGSEGDSLRYLIEFGDGAYTTTPSERHPCRVQNATWGSESVNGRLTVVDRFGRQSFASRSFWCMLLTNHPSYSWVNSFANPVTGRHEGRALHIDSHGGTALSGYYIHPEGTRSHFSGTLSGEQSVRIVLDGGGIEFTGEVFLKPTLPGPYMRLQLKGGSADGVTLKFDWICGTYC